MAEATGRRTVTGAVEEIQSQLTAHARDVAELDRRLEVDRQDRAVIVGKIEALTALLDSPAFKAPGNGEGNGNGDG